MSKSKFKLRAPLIFTGFPTRKRDFFAGLAGLPVESRERKIKHPLIITSFIVLMVVIHIKAIGLGLQDIVKDWGFVASEFYRKLFLTAFTSFFLHGSWLHLFGNAYYFYIFGDDVEDDLKLLPFLTLLFGGHFAGIILSSLLAGHPDIPAVGASAGISALMGYYMIRFPQRRITYMLLFFYVWIQVPALIAFLWKFGWELVIASSGTKTLVGHWAHLGGAAWGIFMALGKSKNSKRR